MQIALRFPFPKRLQPYHSNEFAFLERRLTPRSVFMDIGSPDCKLALQAASYVERVYAIDVSGRFLQSGLIPLNLRLVLCGGVRIPVPEASVDLAYGHRLVLSQLSGICRALKDGGVYWTATKGPAADIRAVLLDAGFSGVRFYVGALRVPYALARLLADPFRLAVIK
jgi:hypothetical protein